MIKNKITLGILFGLCATFAAILIFIALQYLGKMRMFIDPIGMLFCYGPTLTALLFISIKRKETLSSLSLNRCKPVYFLIPVVIVFIASLIYLIIQFVLGCNLQMLQTGQKEIYGITFSGIANILVIFILFTLYSGLGEELGWRGYLLNKLVGLPWLYLLLFLNIIWVFWHIPLFLVGNYKNASVLSFLMFTILTIESGTVLVYLRLKSNSVIPCIILHGSINFFSWLTNLILPQTSFLTSFLSPIHIIAWTPFAIFCYINGKKEYLKLKIDNQNVKIQTV